MNSNGDNDENHGSSKEQTMTMTTIIIRAMIGLRTSA